MLSLTRRQGEGITITHEQTGQKLQVFVQKILRNEVEGAHGVELLFAGSPDYMFARNVAKTAEGDVASLLPLTGRLFTRYEDPRLGKTTLKFKLTDSKDPNKDARMEDIAIAVVNLRNHDVRLNFHCSKLFRILRNELLPQSQI